MRNIICLGGGAFDKSTHLTCEERNLDVVEFAQRERGRKDLRVTYLPTARGDDAESIRTFRRNMSGFYGITRQNIVVVRLFSNMSRSKIARAILDADLVYVAGGNTASLLSVWRGHGLDIVLKRAYHDGTVMVGCSAGALCWFLSGTSDSYGRIRRIENCLGVIPCSYSPHGANKKRVVLHQKLVATGELPDGIVHHDDDTLYFVNEELALCTTYGKKSESIHVIKRNDGADLFRIPANHFYKNWMAKGYNNVIMIRQ